MVQLRAILIPAALCLGVTGAAAAQLPGTAAQTPETIAEIRVHGNHVSDDAAVLALAGIAVGDPFDSTTLAAWPDG